MVLQNYQNLIEMTSNIIYIVAFGVGFKCPRKIHLNTQWGGDFVLGGFCPNNNSTVFYVHHYSKHSSYGSSFLFWGDLVLGGFVPTLILSSLYVSHNGKHSSRSSFVFFMIFLAWGDFVPTRSLPYPMYTITGNIHMNHVLYFGGFCPRGILSQQQLYLILCTPLQLTFI